MKSHFFHSHRWCAQIISLALLVCCVLGGKDYYSILSVSKTAPREEIRKAYKKLSIQYHPDKNPGDETASQKFMEIANAYEVLSDEGQRRKYDRFGEEGLKSGGMPGFHDPFDIFARFTGGWHSSEPQEKRGNDIKIEVFVSLRDIYLGTSLKLELDKQVLCSKCHGSGAKNADDVKTCDSCSGHGVRIIKQMIAPGFYQQMQAMCDVCQGAGKIVKSKCAQCDGKKVMRGKDSVTLQIERGVKDGSTVTFSDAADQGADYVPGDLIVTIREEPHPIFTRRGSHLYVRETLSLVEALTGFERELKHLDNSLVTISRQDITAPGLVQTIEGQGMPLDDYSPNKGNLYVEYSIVFPVGQQLKPAQKREIRDLFSVQRMVDEL